MRDFWQALAWQLGRIFGRRWPVYLGRIWQGEKTPCFYLPPPELQRRLLPCGRVRREIGLELHFYADKQGGADGLNREQAAEKLLRGLAAFAGLQRAYRGWDLRCDLAADGQDRLGREYLRLRGRYVFYTTLELEAADGLSGLPETAELMSYFNFNINEENGEE